MGKKEKDGDLATTYAHCSPLSIELWILIGNAELKTQDKLSFMQVDEADRINIFRQ